jgi:hypothetical protein
MAASALRRPPTDGPDAVIRLPDRVSPPQSPRSSSKRKAQAFLPSPQLRPPPAWSRLSSPATILRPPVPEPLSINSIIRQYCRRRFYVRPLHWTSDHLQLLDCRFAIKRARQNRRLKPRPRPATSTDAQSRLTDNVTHSQQQHQATKPTSKTVIDAAHLILSQAHNTVAKQCAVQELLSVYNFCDLK